MRKMYGWVCDMCITFFKYGPVIAQGKKRELHFCSLRCKAKYLKKE
jgi:hypothetical protein